MNAHILIAAIIQLVPEPCPAIYPPAYAPLPRLGTSHRPVTETPGKEESP